MPLPFLVPSQERSVEATAAQAYEHGGLLPVPAQLPSGPLGRHIPFVLAGSLCASLLFFFVESYGLGGVGRSLYFFSALYADRFLSFGEMVDGSFGAYIGAPLDPFANVGTCREQDPWNKKELVSQLDHIPMYFPDLSEDVLERLAAYKELLAQWNERINLVSEKDVERLELHHILHSLAIARCIRFAPGSSVLDVGTGGGLPGIPWPFFIPMRIFFSLIG